VQTQIDTTPAVRTSSGVWRVLLAVLAPVPMLAQGIYYVLSPVDGGAGFRETVDAFVANPGLTSALVPLNAVFVAGLIPATIAVVWATNRTAPKLTLAGGIVALLGFCVGFALLGGAQTLAFVTARNGLDAAAIEPLAAAAEASPYSAVGGLLFIAGIVIGLTLLGIALWRSKVAPAWLGIALAIGTVTHPFLPGHVAQGLGLLVAAVGFAGASFALLRREN
jgi:hypothetical protein